jgi:hypothetical protein
MSMVNPRPAADAEPAAHPPMRIIDLSNPWPLVPPVPVKTLAEIRTPSLPG